MSVSKQDIVTAIINLDRFLKIPELKGATPKLNKIGSPFTYVGGFNMVFQLEHHTKEWALRVWHVPMGKHIERYQKISNYLTKKNLPYFADFIYDQKALLVNGKLLDTIRMEWLEGKLLKEYIEENLSKKKILIKLADDFLEMCKALRINKISHGDLQEGNILVDSNSNIKLIDYDSICIPELEGAIELVTGLKGYQHPSRFIGSKASLKADFFSELIIYISILAISENSNLWNKYKVIDTQYLLFTETDFIDFEKSEIFKDLQMLSDTIKTLTRILIEYLNEENYLKLESLENYLKAPEIISFNVTNEKISHGNSVDLSWDIKNADTVSIDNGIGDVNGRQKISISPTQDTTYRLVAKNAFGQVTQDKSITVFPILKFNAFRSKHQKIEFGKETQLVWDIENAQKVELHWLNNVEIVSIKGERNISPTEDCIYKLVVTALDSIKKEEKEITVQVYKKVEIKQFVSDSKFIIESLPVKLKWEIENATSIILTSNLQPNIDVTDKTEIEITPKKDSNYTLKASNELFSTESEQITINVQNLPRFDPKSIPVLPKGNELIPKFDLDFKNVSENILSESQINFKDAMIPTNKFSLNNLFKKILNS